MSLRLRRLSNEAEMLREQFATHPLVSVRPTGGDPPDRYRVEYRVGGLERLADGSLVVRKVHEMEIVLPAEYPRQPAACRMLTPVFHPNIDSFTVCTSDFHAAQETLCDLVVRVGQMIAFQKHNVKSPLNAEAAIWCEQHLSRLPVDRQDIYPRTETATRASASAPPSPPTSDQHSTQPRPATPAPPLPAIPLEPPRPAPPAPPFVAVSAAQPRPVSPTPPLASAPPAPPFPAVTAAPPRPAPPAPPVATVSAAPQRSAPPAPPSPTVSATPPRPAPPAPPLAAIAATPPRTAPPAPPFPAVSAAPPRVLLGESGLDEVDELTVELVALSKSTVPFILASAPVGTVIDLGSVRCMVAMAHNPPRLKIHNMAGSEIVEVPLTLSSRVDLGKATLRITGAHRSSLALLGGEMSKWSPGNPLVTTFWNGVTRTQITLALRSQRLLETADRSDANFARVLDFAQSKVVQFEWLIANTPASASVKSLLRDATEKLRRAIAQSGTAP